MADSGDLIISYSTEGLLYWMVGKFSLIKCLCRGSQYDDCWLQVEGRPGFNSMYLAPAHSFLPFMAKETEILVTLDESLVAPRPDCSLESNFCVDMIQVSIGPLDQLILQIVDLRSLWRTRRQLNLETWKESSKVIFWLFQHSLQSELNLASHWPSELYRAKVDLNTFSKERK
jgi:hypothetical protein